MEQVKKMTILVKSVQVSDKTTSRGGKMYNVGFEVGGMGNRAVAFSETIAAELEKHIDKELEVEMGIRDYNGMPSYTIKSAGGVKTSGFGGRGGGYQKDVVSIERQQAAKIAIELMGLVAGEHKKPFDEWKKFAEDVYVWISARPTGAPEQKTDDKPLDVNDYV